MKIIVANEGRYYDEEQWKEIIGQVVPKQRVVVQIAGTWRERPQPKRIKAIIAKKELENLFEKKEEGR